MGRGRGRADRGWLKWFRDMPTRSIIGFDLSGSDPRAEECCRNADLLPEPSANDVTRAYLAPQPSNPLGDTSVSFISARIGIGHASSSHSHCMRLLTYGAVHTKQPCRVDSIRARLGSGRM
jgi:hypothetical protein